MAPPVVLVPVRASLLKNMLKYAVLTAWQFAGSSQSRIGSDGFFDVQIMKTGTIIDLIGEMPVCEHVCEHPV